MKLQVFSSLLLGLVTYLIIVILGLLNGLPLNNLFFLSITGLIITLIGGWLISGLMLSLTEEEEVDITKIEDHIKGNDKSEESSFIPLNPKVLEIEQAEKSEGEGK